MDRKKNKEIIGHFRGEKNRMKDWKKGLFNKTDYDWTDEQFESWRIDNRKEIKFMVDGRKAHKKGVRSISNIMYAHRMDKLKKQKLNIIEQSKMANILWRDHLKRIK